MIGPGSYSRGFKSLQVEPRPSADESTVLLTTDDWEKTTGRDVPERVGRPVVGVDLGAGRAWSAAVALYTNGRTEAFAVQRRGCPRLKTRNAGTVFRVERYDRLYDMGQLEVADGLEVQTPGQVWAGIMSRWGRPLLLVCDRFRLKDLKDATRRRVKIEDRVTRWSEASEDIRRLAEVCQGPRPLSVAEDSRALIETSLARAVVKNDDAGNVRLEKLGSNNTARDDVAAALTLGAGALSRPKPPTVRSLGMA